MHISAEDAIALLRKWQQEKTLLQCVLYDQIPDTDQAASAITGYVEEVDEQKLYIDARGVNPQYGKYFSCHVGLSGAKYQFGETRESPDESFKLVYESFFAILLPSGAMCEILVTRPKTEIVDMVLRKQQ
jgi:hypothetical protein